MVTSVGALVVACGSSSRDDDDDTTQRAGTSSLGGSGGKAGGAGRGGSAGGALAGKGGTAAGQGGGTGGGSGGGSGAATAGRGGSGTTGGSGGAVASGGEAGETTVVVVPLPEPLVYFKEPIGDVLEDVWGADTGDVYAVGAGTIVHDWGDGTFKREHAHTTLQFYSVWGTSATDVYIGVAGGLVVHGTGAGSWTEREIYEASGPVYQAFGFAPDDMYLATGSLFHGRLNAWEEVADPPPAGSVWGSSPTDLYTVATTTLDQPNVYHSTGDGEWRSQATTGEYMRRVFGLGATRVYALGSHSVWFSGGDGSWRSVLTLPDDAPLGLWGRDGLVYVGTQNGKLYATNGEQWSAGQAIGTATGPRINGVWAKSHEDVYLATSSGLYHGTPDGTPPEYAGGGAGGGGSGAGSFSTDPNDFGGESRCTASAILCEDFESGDFADWYPIGDDLSVDTEQAARGDHAFHVHNAASFGGGTIESWDAFPIPYDRFWLRLFVYFDTLPSDVGPYTLIHAYSAVPALGYVSLGGYSDGAGSNVLMHSLYSPSVLLMDSDSNAELPTREWICLEWYNDGLADESRVFWNNVERPSLHATSDLESTLDSGNYQIPEVDYVAVGWGSTSSSVIDLWIDGIAIGPERIGCEN
jgi:hypothetical protein